MMIRTNTEASYVRSASSVLKLGFFGVKTSNVTTMLGYASTYNAHLLLTAPEAYSANRSCIPTIKSAGYLAGASTTNEQTNLFKARADECDIILTDVTHGLRYFRQEDY